mgnify:CR=1 FL=1
MSAGVCSSDRPQAASVCKEYELLRGVVRAPESIEESLRKAITPALSTQGSLAAFELPDAGIVGMSLNTHKTIADNVIEGGYEALNDYRKAALQKLKDLERRDERPGRGTIEWYKGELADKNEKLARVADDIALMSQRLDEVLALAQQMATAAGMQDEFQKRRGELIRKFKITND